MEMFTRILFIGIGGAFGAVARYLLNISPLSNLLKPFPFPTFFINITGSFLIGFLLIVTTDKVATGDNLRFAILVGFLGAFTTFSTFELEFLTLVRDRHLITAFLYLFASVLIGFIGVAGGMSLARKL